MFLHLAQARAGCGQAERVTAPCLAVFLFTPRHAPALLSALDLHGVTPPCATTMKDDPKKPQPVRILKKRSNPAEACDAVPCRKDNERERTATWC